MGRRACRFAVLIGMSNAMNELGVISYFADQIGTTLAAMNLGWGPLFALLHLAFFYIHYLFASQTAHIGALYAAFLALMLGAGVPPILAVLTLAYNVRPLPSHSVSTHPVRLMTVFQQHGSVPFAPVQASPHSVARTCNALDAWCTCMRRYRSPRANAPLARATRPAYCLHVHPSFAAAFARAPRHGCNQRHANSAVVAPTNTRCQGKLRLPRLHA